MSSILGQHLHACMYYSLSFGEVLLIMLIFLLNLWIRESIKLDDTPRVAAGFLKFNVKFESTKIKMIAWQHS